MTDAIENEITASINKQQQTKKACFKIKYINKCQVKIDL